MTNLIEATEEDEKLLGVSVFEKAKNDPLSARKRSLIEDKIQLKAVVDPGVSSKFQDKLLTEIKWIKENMKNQIPAPVECSLWEYSCIIIINTLRRDKWYDNKEATIKRTPYINILYQLFYLQQWYRLWYRGPEYIFTNEENIPIHGQCIDFTDNGFPVLQDEDKMATIEKWGPEKIYRAFNTLMRARLILEHGKVVNLNKTSRISVFMSYCNALRDRLCVICTIGAEGKPEEISRYHKEWFKLVSVNGVLIKNQTIDYVNTNADYVAIGKQIRQFQDSEYKERLKKIQLEENSTLLNTTSLKPIIQENKWKELEGGKEQKLRMLRAELFQCESKLKLLRDGEGLVEEEDAKEIALMERAIKGINKQLQKEGHLYRLFQEKEREEVAKQANEFVVTLTQEGKNEKSHATFMSQARSSYLEQIGVLSNHIYLWLFPSSEINDIWNIHDPFHAGLKDIIRKDICSDFQHMDEAKLLSYIHKEIISRDIIFPEREAYRIQSSPDATFTSLDVCSNQRDDTVNFTEDELGREVQMHTQLPNFPESLPLLLSKPPYDKKSWGIIGHWWLIQKSPGVFVDRCYFLWDIEEEYSSLNRIDIPYPVMSRVGYDWVVMKGGEWAVPNVIGELSLNGYWCGTDFLDALTCWIILTSETWKTKDRQFGNVHNLEYTKLSDLFTIAINSSVDRYGGVTEDFSNEEESGEGTMGTPSN